MEQRSRGWGRAGLNTEGSITSWSVISYGRHGSYTTGKLVMILIFSYWSRAALDYHTMHIWNKCTVSSERNDHQKKKKKKKKHFIYLHQKIRFTPFVNYSDNLCWILFVYRAKQIKVASTILDKIVRFNILSWVTSSWTYSMFIDQFWKAIHYMNFII